MDAAVSLRKPPSSSAPPPTSSSSSSSGVIATDAPSSSAQAPAAVPTLRVMRLQSPELHVAALGVGGGSSSSDCCLRTSLCLPDSLAVYVGERFSAYLGILNGSGGSGPGSVIRKLTVAAQLQTPTARWQLPTGLEGRDVPPGCGVDAVVGHAVEEPGQHILRVEVGYAGSDGAGAKAFRKFYRFNVVSPISFRASCGRYGDGACFVSLSVEHAGGGGGGSSGNGNSGNSPGAGDPLVLASVEFSPAEGLAAEPLGIEPARGDAALGEPSSPSPSSSPTALDLLDRAAVLPPGGSRRYLFRVSAGSRDAALRGIAAGDLLGRLDVAWRRAMGEAGRASSPPVRCPPVPASALGVGPGGGGGFVVHQSGLSVDVAAAAAAAAQSRAGQQQQPPAAAGGDAAGDLSRLLAVTVEPIDPPASMRLHVPRPVQLLVVNHSTQPLAVQVRFDASDAADPRGRGIVACGATRLTLGSVPPNGGSAVASVTLVALSTGLLAAGGCRAVDLASGREVAQPPLFRALVEGGGTGGEEGAGGARVAPA